MSWRIGVILVVAAVVYIVSPTRPPSSIATAHELTRPAEVKRVAKAEPLAPTIIQAADAAVEVPCIRVTGRVFGPALASVDFKSEKIHDASSRGRCARDHFVTSVIARPDFDIELAPGRYALLAAAETFQPSKRLTIEVSNETPLPPIELYLAAGASITVQVTPAFDTLPANEKDHPLAEREVRAIVWLKGHGFDTARFAGDGGFAVIEGLMPGCYELGAIHPRLGVAAGRYHCSGPELLKLPLVRRPPLKGRVVDRRGQPVAGAIIRSLSSGLVKLTGEPVGSLQGSDRRLNAKGFCLPQPSCWPGTVSAADGTFELNPEEGFELMILAWTPALRGVLHVDGQAVDAELRLEPFSTLPFLVESSEFAKADVDGSVDESGESPPDELFVSTRMNPSIRVPVRPGRVIAFKSWPGLNANISATLGVCLRPLRGLSDGVHLSAACDVRVRSMPTSIDSVDLPRDRAWEALWVEE